MSPLSIRERLEHVLERIEEIEAFTAEGQQAFFDSLMMRRAVLYDLLTIGEAVAALPDDLRAEHAHVPWGKIVALRNILAHVYFDIQLETIWGIISYDLPERKHHVEKILSDLSE